MLDLERESAVDAPKFRSKGRNTPFKNWPVKGDAVMTIVGGRLVHDSR